MPDYIVCQKKRNNPRMDIRICESRCPHREECKEFLARQGVARQSAQPSVPRAAGEAAMELEAA